MEFVAFFLLIAIAIAGAVYSALQAKRRREELARLAESLGLQFHPDKDHSLDEQYGFLDKLCQGSNRYAFNRMHGQYQGHDLMAFDYHYETHSTNSKGRRQTHHHYFSFFLLHLPAHCPELTIVREGWGSKLAQLVGYDDIDFESAEFSRKFCVRSRDKKFAYDICNALMMDYLLGNPDLSVEIDAHCLSLMFPSRLAAGQIAHNFNRLLELRKRVPAYLWNS
jgi:hypothetical protein